MESDDGNDGAAGEPSSSGGSAGTAGAENGGSSGSAGTSSAGTSGNGFDCTSSTEPGPLVEVPAGAFIMGCDLELDDECLEDEMPMHTVTLAAFEIDLTEVTQDAFTACVTAGACDPPACEWNCDATEIPAGCITIEQAEDYCAWADRRLPTEAEWEKAARGEDGVKFPWGNGEPDCTLANMAGCGNEATPVGSLPDGASPYGALDMGGNVVEMVSDWYDPSYYEQSPSTDPTGPATGTRYGGRGGGFLSEPTWHRAAKRDWYDIIDEAPSLGFRCAR
jgi:formylglycine-generating enzyme required for sulfatase activity